MSNALKYIKSLEAAGFARAQAEAQVQMVLDILEGDLVTKSDLSVLQERIDARFAGVNTRFVELESRMDKRFAIVDTRLAELELRLTTRIGLAIVTSSTILLSVLGYLIKTN